MAKLKRERYAPKKGTRGRTTGQAIERAALAARCLELRREGLSNKEIADRLSVDESSTLNESRVSTLITGALRDMIRPASTELIVEEVDRLDRLFNRAYRIAMGDNNRDRVPALAAALKAMERRSALLGLDAPKQVDIKDDRTHAPDQATIEAVVAQLAAEASKVES